MPLGEEREFSTVNQDDSAELYAYLFSPEGEVTLADEIDTVEYTVQLPDGTRVTQTGSVETDGAGFLRFTDTSQTGEYIAVARFTLASGEVQSTRLSFSVIDPFDPVTPTGTQIISEATWSLLEDCFDSEEGGPWLRDQTLSYFNRDKINMFVPFALLEVNAVMPETNLDLLYFTQELTAGELNPALPIMAYGTLIHVIRHLMRSYVEQPNPVGPNVVWDDRRDYLQRWQMILQDLETEFQRLLILWKRQFLNLGRSALLVHSKAGRLYGPGAPGLRLRNAGRGYGF